MTALVDPTTVAHVVAVLCFIGSAVLIVRSLRVRRVDTSGTLTVAAAWPFRAGMSLVVEGKPFVVTSVIDAHTIEIGKARRACRWQP